jgi:Fe2+ transport system protein FeoA
MPTPNTATLSLAAAQPGEQVEIRRILFGALRGLCSDLGIFEGQVVRCRAGQGSQLLLQTADGRNVALERDWARFIQVAQPELTTQL